MSDTPNGDTQVTAEEARDAGGGHFISRIIEADIRDGKHDGRVHTRFPPEPNGHLHIGHAKAIHVNFSLAEAYGGLCNLRFDDTNPIKEEQRYVDGMIDDIHWLGFDWGDRLYFASDYFDQLYEWAVQLVRDGRAYVDGLSADEIREHRGTLTEPGRNSPDRDRPVDENLDLLHRMRAGEFPDGSYVLRAKIDMAAANMNLRDPVMYRIVHATHHRTGDAWCIYPTYDWTHGQSDSIEGVTHSLCSLEFEDHRPLYDWYLDQLDVHRPQQIEFARLNVTHTITSKRKLIRLVEEGHVNGWDDPRMPTLAGLRRRGYTPEAIRSFLDGIGVAKADNTIEIARLEHELREDLNRRAPRAMAVLHPLKVVIDNYPDDASETFEVPNNPEDPDAGVRQVPFSRELFIEQSDFMEDPPRKFFRLAPGREVRLKSAYYVTCTQVIKDDAGQVVELHCTYDPASRGGSSPDGRRVKGTLHWVSARHAVEAEVRVYDHLFKEPFPESAAGDLVDSLNPESLQVLTDARVEPSIARSAPGDRHQFMRLGYFVADVNTTPERPVFNRTVSLKDSWAKSRAKG